MHITSTTLRTIAWSTLVFSTARAQYVIDNLSFGQKDGQPISPNLRGIPHFHTKGEGWDPDILSDRILLTPPWPGNKRGSLWSEEPLHHSGDWSAELHFRVSGMERGGGNLQIWYTRESQKNDVPASLYTANKFDGLVLVVDQYEGRGGSVRGFLNDGNMDIKAHTDPDTLSFGQCNYAYRNLGRLSVISLKQANGVFEVRVDGDPCFSTDKVRLPEGYYFGITASSAENPDSFEIHKFVTSTTNSYTREEPNRQHQDPNQYQQAQDPNIPAQERVQPPPRPHSIPKMIEDVFAANIRSQQDQFTDLHNRMQDLAHRVTDLYELLDSMAKVEDERYNHLMGRIVPMHDQMGATMRNVEKVERTTMETLRDLESKDFKDMLNQVHHAIERSHDAISNNMPLAMATIVGKEKPSMSTFLFIAVAVQIMVVGAYAMYKKRRESAPKKYL